MHTKKNNWQGVVECKNAVKCKTICNLTLNVATGSVPEAILYTNLWKSEDQKSEKAIAL